MEYLWYGLAILAGFAVAIGIGALLLRSFAFVFVPPVPPPVPIPAPVVVTTPVVAPVVTPVAVATARPPVATRISGLLRIVGKVLLTILVVGIGVALLLGLYRLGQNYWPTTITMPTTPVMTLPSWNIPYIDWVAIALAFAAIAAVGAGMWFFDDKKRLVTYVYVIAVVLLVYYLYRYDLLNIPRTIPLYVLVGVGAVMVWSYVKGFAWFSLELLLVVAFFMLGYSHHHTWGQFTSDLASIGSGGGSGPRQVASTTPSCDGVPTKYLYSSGTTYRINENLCQLRGYVHSGCVTWLDTFKAPVARTCDGPMPAVPNIVLMRADSDAVVRLNHCRNFAPGNLVDACG